LTIYGKYCIRFVVEVKVFWRTKPEGMRYALFNDNIFIVPEWEKIYFEGETLKVQGEDITKGRRLNGKWHLVYTFKNISGYVPIELDGKKHEVLVISKKLGREFTEENLFQTTKKDKMTEVKSIIEKYKKLFSEFLNSIKFPFDLSDLSHWPSSQGREAAFLYWKIIFLNSRVDDIKAALSIIMQRAHSRLLREEKLLLASKAKKLSPSSLRRSLYHRQYIVGAHPYFLKVYQDSPEETFNTPENQFVKFAVSSWLRDLQKAKKVLQKGVPDALEELRTFFIRSLNTLPLAEAEGFYGIPSSSYVLQKAPGYRLINRLWAEYQWNFLPQASEDAITLKRIDLLWEYRVLFWLLEKLKTFNGKEKWRLGIRGLEGGCIFEGIFKGKRIKLYYQKSEKSYSLSLKLRPDFILEVKQDRNSDRYILDAKFGFVEKVDEEIGEMEEFFEIREEENNKGAEQTKREAKPIDLVKMHAYRDALKAKAVIAVIPGEKEVVSFFPEDNDNKEKSPENMDIEEFLNRILGENANENGKELKGIGYIEIPVINKQKGG